MRRAFTLVELVVVVLIMGILGAVAAPRCLSTSDAALDNCVKKSLSVVRDAIEMFNAKNERLPGADGDQATFKSDLAPYIRKFPVLSVGPGRSHNDSVLMDGSAGPVNGEVSPTDGWRYYYNTGVFIINLDKKLKSDNSIEYDQL